MLDRKQKRRPLRPSGQGLSAEKIALKQELEVEKYFIQSINTSTDIRRVPNSLDQTLRDWNQRSD